MKSRAALSSTAASGEYLVVDELSPSASRSIAARATASWANRHTYCRIAKPALLLYCFSAAISVALAQVILIPLSLYWMTVTLLSSNKQGGARVPLSAPILGWFFVCLLSAFWGADPAHSVSEVLKGSVFLMLPFAVAAAIVWRGNNPGEQDVRSTAILIAQLLGALIVGQTIAAAASVCEQALEHPFFDRFPGALTESGQLVFILPLLIASFFFLREQAGLLHIRSAALEYIAAAVLLFCWATGAQSSPLKFTLLAVALSLIVTMLRRITVLIRSIRNSSAPPTLYPFLRVSGLLLAAAFLINLKRGPWLGVFLEIVLFGMLFSRRLVFWAVAGCAAALIVLTPVRTRLQGSIDDFSIQGGRQNMWTMGTELIQSFPLGIGFGNSRLMRVLDPTLPSRHRHMHNNILQVGVETGWLGLSVYLWWMCAVLHLGLKIWKNHGPIRAATAESMLVMVAVACTAAILGWQCAGIVEYNFGDAEIRLIALLYMGILLSIREILARAEH